MNHCIRALCFLLISFSAYCQDIDTTYTYVGDIVGDNVEGKSIVKSPSFWNFEEQALHEVMGYLKDKEAYKKEREQNIGKLTVLQNTWQQATNKPDTIVDGWHNAVATDNVNYYKIAKVLVKQNKIKKVVMDDYLPLSFLAAGEIKKAKSTISLEKEGSGSLDLLELYFIYDLDGPVLVSEPNHAGYVCLWSDFGKIYKDISVKIDNSFFKTPFKNRLVGDPECFSEDMLCLPLKPGIHTITFTFRGPIHPIVKNFVVKPDMCLRFRVGMKKKMKK